MAITNLYSNLPGHLVEFKDGGMQLRSTAVTGNSKSLLILGTAIDGPVNEPVAIDAENVHKLFGNDIDDSGVPNGTTLTKYARQAYKAGFNDIRCMRVTGSVAQAVISKTAETSSELVKLVSSFIADGNKAYQATLPFPGTIPAGQYPAIKQQDVVITHPIVTTGIANTFTLPNKLTVLADQVPARGDITVNYKTQLVDTTNVLTAAGAKVTSNSAVNGSGDNIIEVTVPAASLVNVYQFNMDGLTPGVATEDNHSVPTDANLHAVTDKVGATIYQSIEAINASAASVVITSIVEQSDGDYVISFVDTGSAGTPTYAINDAFTVKYVGYTSVDGTVTITQSNLYTPQYIVVDTTKVPVLTEEVYLYDATGNNLVSKMSDATGVIVYDTVSDRFVVDLSKVPNTIPLGYITTNATLKLSYSYEVTETQEESIIIKSLYGGSVYNQGSVTVDLIVDSNGNQGRLFTLNKPASKKYTTTEAPLTFKSFDYPTFGALRDAIAAASLNNVFEAVTDYEDALTKDVPINTVTNSSSFALTGGSDGVNPTNDEMFVALSGRRDASGNLLERGAYQILENYHVDYIYVAGVYADSKVSASVSANTFHYELALLCAVLTYRTKMTHGFIDMKPNTNTTLVGIQAYVDKLLEYENIHYMKDSEGSVIYDEDGNPMDIGWYTSAVVGPEPVCTSSTLGTYYGSSAIAYAALNASLSAQSAPTNKKLPGCTGMRFKFSNKQLNDLTGNRFVTFKLKNEGTTTATKIPYVVDGCTCGASTSDYKRLTTVKVVTQVIDEVREVADPFIGEPNTVEQRNALAALISKRLSVLKENGVIQYSEFEIAATTTQVLEGECSIALTLVPPQELRKITTVVALRATA